MLPVAAEDIINLIPQRFPMVMIARLLSHSEAAATVDFEIKAENLFVEDGVLQESGLLEHMAQAVAAHTGYGFYIRKQKAPTGYIGSIQKAEIVALPLIGDILTTEVHIIQEFMGVTLVNISSKVNDKTIATAQMKTVIASTS